jgi:glutamate decarboxylase
MVHLNRVTTTAELKGDDKITEGFSTIQLDDDDLMDDFTATVYGSKYAADDLPRHEMPDKEMPPQV